MRQLLRRRAYCWWYLCGLCDTRGGSQVSRRKLCSKHNLLHAVVLLFFGLALVGGLMNRIRGGWLGDHQGASDAGSRGPTAPLGAFLLPPIDISIDYYECFLRLVARPD